MDTVQEKLQAWAMLYGDEEGPSLGMLVSMLRTKPLEMFEQALANCITAEAVGPLLDPTCWMCGGKENVESHMRLARALLDFRKAIDGMEVVNNEAH